MAIRRLARVLKQGELLGEGISPGPSEGRSRDRVTEIKAIDSKKTSSALAGQSPFAQLQALRAGVRSRQVLLPERIA